jgi:hypothetical protein
MSGAFTIDKFEEKIKRTPDINNEIKYGKFDNILVVGVNFLKYLDRSRMFADDCLNQNFRSEC